MNCPICSLELESSWRVCPSCGIDIEGFRRFKANSRKFERHLVRIHRDWKNLDAKIVDGFKRRDLRIIDFARTPLEQLIKRLARKYGIKYSGYMDLIRNLHEEGYVTDEEDAFLGMVSILRNVIQHGGQLEFDPVYFNVLIKALNCGVEAYVRAYGLAPEDVDEYFVPPKSFTKILKMLEGKGIVLITGEPLIGKTTIAKKLEKDFAKRGFEVVRDGWDVELKEKRLFVFDNGFGESNIDRIRLRKTIEFLERYLMEEKGEIKIVLTSRNDVFEKVKDAEEFKSSKVSDVLQRVRVNVTIDDYSNKLNEILKKSLAKNRVREVVARKILEYSGRILSELVYPGELDNLCRLAKDLSKVDDDVIRDLVQRSKFIETWISKKLESLRFDEKAWLILLCILGKVEIPAMESFLIEFGKEIHKCVDPGSSIEIEDIYLHLNSRMKNISDVVEIKSEEFFDEVWMYLNFTHERVREIVLNFVLSTALEDLKKVLDILIDLRKRFDKVERKLVSFVVEYYDLLPEYRTIVFQRLEKLSKACEKPAITELRDILSNIVSLNRPEIRELLLSFSKHELVNTILLEILKDEFDRIDEDFGIRLFKILLDNSKDDSRKFLLSLYFKHFKKLSQVTSAESLFNWLVEHPEIIWDVFKVSDDEGKIFIIDKLEPSNPLHRKALTAMLLELGYNDFWSKGSL